MSLSSSLTVAPFVSSLERTVQDLDLASIPRHLAFIMDGNRRWAKEQGLTEQEGHLKGGRTAKHLVEEAAHLGVNCVSLFVLSTENLQRPSVQVRFLMHQLRDHFEQEESFYQENQVQVRHSGDPSLLSSGLRQALERLVSRTAQNSRMYLNLAIAYGGQDEILRAFNRFLKGPLCAGGIPVPKRLSRAPNKRFTLKELHSYLDNPDLPSIDLLIRTGKEQRLSNFFLLQSAYAEIYFSQKYWPVWSKNELYDAFLWYAKRNRRFGRE